LLLDALGSAADQASFLPLLDGIRAVLAAVGVQADRIQLPMTRYSGFRHPTLSTVVLTWCHDRSYDETLTVNHGEGADEDGPRQTPYRVLLQEGAEHLRADLTQLPANREFPILAELRDRGYQDYLALRMPLPQDGLQLMSIASLKPMPADLVDRLAPMLHTVGLAVYATYRTSQATRLAATYIGPRSGPRVLAGDIRRGSTRRLTAGIMFCDIRGFTALSTRTTPEAVVSIVNQVFERIEREAARHDGEILKFIGDAVLVVFPVEERAEAEVARSVIETTKSALASIDAADLPVSIRVGATIGEVVQGNIGTPERLDFTVMGPAVNLASRLEGLCRPLEQEALFCSTLAALVPELVGIGAHPIKGLTAPVEVYRLGERSVVAAP
jgi:adenylate cyclase